MLKVLLKQKELREAQASLAKAQATSKELDKREAELAKDIENAKTDEEREAVESAVDAFSKEREDNTAGIDELEQKIAELEEEIAKLEKKQDEEPTEDKPTEEEPAKRKDTHTMRTRTTIGRMNAQETRAFIEREDVKKLLSEVRTAIREQRAVTGAELTIPQVMLDLLRENITEWSKLYKHINVVAVSGNAVKPVMGTIPEAVWTQVCGKINELSLVFNAAEVGSYKVAGYFQLCKATEEDSDIDLASEIVAALGAAIGLALDKAIIFGLGTRMPQGIFTRLAQTTKPADYSEDERPWVDLHTTNIITISTANSEGVKLFKNIVLSAGKAKGKYSRGEKVWTMNETTYTTLQAEGLSVNAAGEMVTAIEGRMPVVGGIVEVLDFLPDNVIIGGYMDLYLLAERAGTTIARSDEVKFLDDAVVWKGTARYDGKPVIAEGFVAIGINNVTPSASGISFAPDTANATPSES